MRVFDLVDTDDRPGGVELVQRDIRDREAAGRACAGAGVVYHCVAQVPLAKDCRLFRSVNIGGTKDLVPAARAAGARKVVSLSLSAVYGVPERNPVDDGVRPRPLEDYGRAKLAGEELARWFAAETGLDLTIFRPRTILGHGRLGIFALLFNWIAEGKDVFVLGRGDNHYQLVRAEDLAEACVLAAARPGAGKMSAIPGTECTAPKCSRSQGATGRCTADWRPVD